MSDRSAPAGYGTSYATSTGHPSGSRTLVPSRQAPESSDDDLAEIANKLNNPFSSLWLIFNQHDTVWFEGDISSGRRPQHNFKFQPVMPLPFTDNYNLILRPVFPFGWWRSHTPARTRSTKRAWARPSQPR